MTTLHALFTALVAQFQCDCVFDQNRAATNRARARRGLAPLPRFNHNPKGA